jgi:hypothetical protein
MHVVLAYIVHQSSSTMTGERIYMKENYTDINIVLDRSGSMETVKSDTIGGFNAFLNEQKAVEGKATITLVQFDDIYEEVYKAVNISEAKPLDDQTFVPRGWTALLDAIGRTIIDIGKRLASMKEDERPANVIFVILTDGLENSSREFNSQQISEMIKHQRDVYKWEFVFLGANQDAIVTAGNMGITQANALTYAANPAGTQAAFGSVARNVAAYRMGVAASPAFSDEDREIQKKSGA